MKRIETITSSGNATMKRVRKLLASRKARREQSRFVVEGLNAVAMLLDHPQDRMALETVILSESFMDSVRGECLVEKLGDMRLIRVADSLMDRVGDARTSQGVMAVLSIMTPTRLEVPERGAFLLLDSIADPGNMGTLIRTAVGLGVDGVLVYGDSVDIYNPKCVRSAAGTLPFVPVWEAGESDIGSFLDAGYDLFAARMTASQSILQAEFGERLIIAVGNEAHGLSSVIEERATREIAIPLRLPCESLNAAIAGGIMIFVAQAARRDM